MAWPINKEWHENETERLRQTGQYYRCLRSLKSETLYGECVRLGVECLVWPLCLAGAFPRLVQRYVARWFIKNGRHPLALPTIWRTTPCHLFLLLSPCGFPQCLQSDGETVPYICHNRFPAHCNRPLHPIHPVVCHETKFRGNNAVWLSWN